MPDLRVNIAGLELPHPFLLASGPLSWSGAAVARAHRAGAAAVVTKTIALRPATQATPHIACIDRAVLNCERWSDLDPERWVEREIPLAKRSGAVVIASVGLGPVDVETLAPRLERAGASALEVVSYDEAALPGLVRAAASRVHVPVLAKLPGNCRALEATARACVERGASGLTVTDSVGPALRIDVRTQRPLLGAASAWLSGPAILPLALHAVAAVRRRVSVPILGTGGVESADAAVEMLLAGANAIGMCSGPLAHGLGLFARLRGELDRRLSELGFGSAAEAVGALRTEAAPMVSIVLDAARCSRCGACIRACPCEARRSPEAAGEECRACGLCVSVCPTGALAWKGSGR